MRSPFNYRFGLPSPFYDNETGFFSPASLFALAEPGVWFDPSDLTTLFQDPAGTTPVTAPGNTVGLMLDKSRGLVASTKGGQMDGVVGGSFDTPSATANQITGDIDIRMRASLLSWTPAATTTLCSRVLTGVSTGDSYEFWINTSGVLQLLTVSGTTTTNVASSASVGFAAGTTNWVRVTWQQSTGFVNFYTSSDGVTWTQNGTANRAGTTSATNAGTRPLRFGARSDGASGSFPLNGKIYRAQIYNGINGTLAVDFNPTLYASGATYTAATGEVWTITGLYARIVPDGSHATQATIAARPTYSVEPVGGRRNLLTWSEDFRTTAQAGDTRPWLQTAVTPSASTDPAPNGTLTASKIVPTTATSQHVVNSATFAAGTYTQTVYAKADGYNHLIMGSNQLANMYAWFNLATGETGTKQSEIATTSMTPVGNGWYRCQLVSNYGGSVTYRTFAVSNADNVFSFAGNGTSGILLWGAQLETGSTATNYQRVTTQYDVTEAGVASVSYLYFDGGSDSMATSTITPGIDKAQVFAGVRKLRDSPNGMLLELSSTFANPGTFALQAPWDNGSSYRFVSNGNGGIGIALPADPFNAPITNVLTGLGDISGDRATLRANGTQAAQSTDNQGTGNYLAYPLYLGGRAGTSLFFSGHLYSLITRFGPVLDAPTIASTETWVAGKTGIDIAKITSTTIYTRSGDTILDRANSIIERRTV